MVNFGLQHLLKSFFFIFHYIVNFFLCMSIAGMMDFVLSSFSVCNKALE